LFPPEFIPIVNHGMSIFTAGIFFFMGIGSVFLYSLFKRELQRINTKIESQAKITTEKIKDVNSKVDLLFAKVDDTNISISDIKTHIAGMHETVKWIQKSISNTERNNNQIKKSLTLITEGLLDNDQIPRRK